MQPNYPQLLQDHSLQKDLFELISKKYPVFAMAPHYKERDDSKKEDVIQGVDTSLWTDGLTLPIICDILLFSGYELSQKNLKALFFTKKDFDGEEHVLAEFTTTSFADFVGNYAMYLAVERATNFYQRFTDPGTGTVAFKEIPMALNFVGNQVIIDFKVVEDVCKGMVGQTGLSEDVQVNYWEFLLKLIEAGRMMQEQ